MPTRLPDRVAVFALAAMTLAAVVSVAAYWGARVEYADRFLILTGAVWAGWKAWPTRPARPSWSSSTVGLILVTAASLAFPVAWLLQVQIGPRVLLLWWQFGAIAAAAAGLILVRGGWPKLRACGFALLFPFLALPIPARFQIPLQTTLQSLTTTTSGCLLSIPYEVTQSKFILTLPGGPLEVAEACSGVRSLTALVAITAFVAFLRGFGPVGGSLLMLFAIPAVVATNVLRVVLSGVIQETFGAGYIRGDWHEALGFAMVLVGLAGVLGLAAALEKLAAPWPVDCTVSVTDALPRTALLHWLTAGLLVASTGGTGYAVRLGWQAVSESMASVPLDRVPLRIGDWVATGDEAIPANIRTDLAFDSAVYRVYSNNLGQDVHCWLQYWSSLSAIRGYHHPDWCWGGRGAVAELATLHPVAPAAGGELPLTVRRFKTPAGTQFVLYWTQDGRRVWDDVMERNAKYQSGGINYEYGWVTDLLKPPANRPPGRLTVVLVSRHVGPTAEREMTEFARRIADEIYAVCPWAAPPRPAGEESR